MRVVATLLVRDEEEIVRECIEHHLKHGVDGFIVTDNKSKDGTRKILEGCPGIYEIINEPTHNHHQAKWVSKMARHAYELGAHWVVHIDADEFWEGLEILHDTKRFSRTGVIAVKREWVHVPVEGLEFGKFRRDQMPYCRRVRKPMPKVIHRAVPKPHVSHGNHFVLGVHGHHVGTPKEISIHHYPVRSYGHFEAKTIKGGQALKKHPGPTSNGKRWRHWYHDFKRGRLPELYAEKLYLPDKIATGLQDGSLIVHIPEEYRDKSTSTN